jgi:hypothetical protein
MSMAKVEQALALTRAKPEKCDFVGPRSEELIQAAEAALGFRLPPMYRRFVSELGAGGAGSSEIYGVIDANFLSGPFPDGIWLTLNMRENPGFALPISMVIVGEDGYGGYYVLDTANAGQDGEPSVQMWEPWHTGSVDTLEFIAPDFGTWFLYEVRFGLRDDPDDWESIKME